MYNAYVIEKAFYFIDVLINTQPFTFCSLSKYDNTHVMQHHCISYIHKLCTFFNS